MACNKDALRCGIVRIGPRGPNAAGNQVARSHRGHIPVARSKPIGNLGALLLVEKVLRLGDVRPSQLRQRLAWQEFDVAV